MGATQQRSQAGNHTTHRDVTEHTCRDPVRYGAAHGSSTGSFPDTEEGSRGVGNRASLSLQTRKRRGQERTCSSIILRVAGTDEDRAMEGIETQADPEHDGGVTDAGEIKDRGLSRYSF